VCSKLLCSRDYETGELSGWEPNVCDIAILPEHQRIESAISEVIYSHVDSPVVAGQIMRDIRKAIYN